MSYMAIHRLIASTLLVGVVFTSSLSIAVALGGDDTCQPSSQLSASDGPSQPVRVACIGDSITYGMGIKDREQESYPARLQRLLGDGYEVRNFGRSGADVLSVNNGPYAKTSEHRAALDFRPHIVICNLGINDHALLSQHQDEFVRDYASLLAQYTALSTNPRLYIWTHLAPVMPGQANHAQCEQLRDTFTTLLQKVAKETGASGIDMHTPLVGHAEWFPDNLHPNERGANAIARHTADTIAGRFHVAKTTTASNAAIVVDFEEAPAGAVRQLTTPVGQWIAEPGHAEITPQHGRNSKQSLRVLGGEDRSIQLLASPATQNRQVLSFWAERWTTQNPFRFRIEQLEQDQWVEIFKGDDKIRVGGFLTHVMVPLLPEKQVTLRMKLTTPASSGLLIDDVKLAEAIQMQVTGATVDQPVVPALVGNEWSAITRVRVDVDGNSGTPPSVGLIQATTDGTVYLSDIAKVQIFYTAGQSLMTAANGPNAFSEANPFGEQFAPSPSLTVQGAQPLSPGPNYFWITYQLKKDANLDHLINAIPTKVQLADGREVPIHLSGEVAGQRLGVAVRRRGDDGVHTYRIPGLATTVKGTLIAVYDIRRRNGGDLPGDIDVGMSRSTDGGRTWEPMKVIMDMGSDPKWRFDGVGDPAVLVDRQSNTIWVAAVWSHGNRAWHGSQPGLAPQETGQLMLVRSNDDGATWSKPINITKQVKKPEWCFLLQGPGNGITMKDGTLVFPAQYQDTPSNGRLPRSTIMYSRDQGETWQIGAGAFDDTTEAQVVELDPGVLMLNCRYNREPYRVVTITRDMGKTWEEHPSSRKALIEPHACMASLIAIQYPAGDNIKNWLLFSNPHSLTRRERMSIQASGDADHAWPDSNRLLLDEATSAGYSCLSMIDDQTVGILYEGSQSHMTFQRIPLREIVKE